MEKQQRRAPLLFISQPDFQISAPKMQDTFSLKKMQKKRNEKAPPAEQEKTIIQEDNFFRRVKPFKDMDIHEKINYLANFPEQLSPVPCLFEENWEKQHRGYFIGMENDEIIILLADKREVAIKISDITNIRLLGLG